MFETAVLCSSTGWFPAFCARRRNEVEMLKHYG